MADREMNRAWYRSAHWVGLLGFVLLATGSYIGLIKAPAERYMGDVGRILYIHVPTAWVALLMLAISSVVAVGLLINRRDSWEDVLVGAVEVGVVMVVMLLIQGSIWAKPTWGVYWTWDPRLTTSVVLLVSFIGVLGLRGFVDDARRRATWTAVTTIVASANLFPVYFSIKWWRTLHQPFSTPETVAATMKLPLRINAFAMLFIGIWLVILRARVARMERARLDQATETPPASELIAGDQAR